MDNDNRAEGRYSVESGGPIWSMSEDLFILEYVLVADSQIDFERRCLDASRELERGHRQEIQEGWKDNGDLVKRRLWGLATGLAKLEGFWHKKPEQGSPASWAEKTMVRWAFMTKVRRAKKQDTSTLAILLGRPEGFVTDLWKEIGPAQGREGFGLC